MADRLIPLFILLFHGLDETELLAARLHGQLDEGIPRTRGGGWTQDLDLTIRQVAVDLPPGLEGVGNQLVTAFRIGHVFSQGQEDILRRQVEPSGLFRISDGDPVVTDLHLHDVRDAILPAGSELRALDAARGVRDVRMIDADPGAEQLETATGTGGLDLRRLERGCAAEVFGDRGRERKHGGGTDDGDEIAGNGQGGEGNRNRHDDGDNERLLHGNLTTNLWMQARIVIARY